MADVVLQGYAADCAAAVHHLPCGIKHDGAARVSTFFVPQRARPATDDSGAERAAPLIAYFRGRELEGHEVELPAGVVGLVFQEAGRAGVGGASGAGGAGARTTGGVARASGAVAAPNAAAKAGTVGRGGYGPKSGGPAGYGPKSGGGAAARNSDDDDGGDDDDEPDIGFVMPPSDDDDDDEVEEDDCEGAGASAVATGGAADSVVASEASTASPATAAPATEADRVWRIDSAFTKVTYWHHDEPPGDTDMVRTAVDWFAIAAAAQVLSIPAVANNEWLAGTLRHPAGPFTIHFWAPTAKWLITFANIADLNRPVEKLSLPQQTAVTATGIIWSRYATQITPVNYNLLTVNVFMAATGIWQLYRIASHKPTVAPTAA